MQFNINFFFISATFSYRWIPSLLIPFTIVGGSKVFMTETLDWSTSSPTAEILCLKTISSITMK